MNGTAPEHRTGQRGGKNHPARAGNGLYRAIVAGRVELSDFQLLCANCNWIKRAEHQEHNQWSYRKGA